MPYYKKLKEFKRVLPKNAYYFQRNGIEVIILLDEPSEEVELIKLIKQYPFINFKIVINREEHEWRNPCKTLNIGIKQASFNYILVLDPEVELITDVIYKLRYTISFYPNTFTTGVVSFIDYEDDSDNISLNDWIPFGSIMATKNDLIKIKGYDENFKLWGGEEDQIRRKLNLIGIKKIELEDAKTVHREQNSDGYKERSKRMNKMSISHLKNIFYPKKAFVNGKDWGTDFSEIIWNWKSNKSYSQLIKYVSKFQDSYIVDKKAFQKPYEIIVLIQTKNESKNVPEVLTHLNNFCDGIILLDDGSTDDTYEKSNDKKLLVKAKKLYKGYFDDLENRNQLLRIASFFKSEWFIFIDADERIDSRFCNIRKYANNNKNDVYGFFLVDLWDNTKMYRIDVPDKRENGIAIRKRMFRNKGNMQISYNREIHFPPIPYNLKLGIAKILILHYGNFDSVIRERKFNLYTSQDNDGKKIGHSYSYLKDKNVILKSLKSIKLNKI